MGQNVLENCTQTMNKEDLHVVFTGQTFTTKKNSIPGIVPTKMTSKEGVPAQNMLILPFSAGFGLSKHVIRDTPPCMVFISVRFLLRSIHVPSSQRSFVVST